MKHFNYRTLLSPGVLCLALIGWAGPSAGQSGAGEMDYHLVTEAELDTAMARVTGFDPVATTNGPRFQAGVIFELVKMAEQSGRPELPLLVPPGDWFRAFLKKTNLDAGSAPQYARLAHEYGQYKWVDPRPEKVIGKIKKGERPQQAMNIMIWWPEDKDGPDKYSYKDTLSTPKLKVTDHRVITYRLVDFGDRFFFDDIKGLSGRPTSGLLGLLFRVIGEGRVVQTGMSVAEDGLMVVRGKAKKGFMGVTSTATIAPDGKSKKDVPEDRPDLKFLEDLLKSPFEIKYREFKWSEDMDRLVGSSKWPVTK